MAYASHVINHSKKLRNVPNLLWCEHAILVRWFSNAGHPSLGKREDILKIHRHGYVPAERFSKSATSSTASSLGMFRKNLSTMTLKAGNPVAGSLCNKELSCSQLHLPRGFSSGSDLPPHQEIGMPSLSPTMTEGNIARWLKKEGDKVSPGEVLCEVETDKATVEMECMEEGYLAKIIKGDGSKEIKVGEVIAITVEEEEDIAKLKDYSPASDAGFAAAEGPSTSTPPKEVVEEPVSAPESKISKPSSAPTEDRIFASPLAKKMAEDHKVHLSSIKGTGPDGHIVKADIEDYLASRGKEVSATTPKAKDRKDPALDYVDISPSQIRKVTASRLSLSKQTIPHYYLTVDTCVDKLMDLRSQLNSLQEASGGKRISVNDLVIKGIFKMVGSNFIGETVRLISSVTSNCMFRRVSVNDLVIKGIFKMVGSNFIGETAAALALRKVPQCNSSWTDEYIRQYDNVNINVAVQTDNGLYVPVVKDADKKGLSKIAEEVRHLAQKAKENSLKPEDFEGGTFTVSNLGGPYGIKQFCAVINPPQSGILAVGSAEKRVVPGTGSEQFEFASFMSVTLSCDHRVIDGAIGAEWLKAFKGYIENPESMLL